MKQKLKKSLHFGCQITINIQENKESYVQSDGIINPVAFLLNQNESINSPVFEVYSNIFRVIPAIRRPEQDKFAQISLQQFHDFNKDNKSEISSNDLKILYQKVLTESHENNSQLLKSLKKPVEFGEDIMLQHVKSGNFLSQAQINDNNNKQTYKLCMIEVPDRYSWFNIIPCYQYQASCSQYVEFGQNIYIASKINAVTTWYVGLNVNKEYDNNKNNLRNLLLKAQKSQVDDTNLFNLQTLHLNASKSSKFCINLYRKQVGDGEEDLKGINQEHVHYGDYVWLNHPELDCCLYFSKQSKLFKFQEQDEMGLWCIEAQGQQTGARIKWDSKVRLRNLILNQYLQIIQEERKFLSKINDQLGLGGYKLNLTSLKDDNSLFYVSKVSSIQSDTISDGTTIFLTNYVTKLHISTKPGDDIIRLTQNPHKYDVFQFIRPSPLELWEINFLNAIKIYINLGIITLRKFQDQSFKKGYENTNNEIDFINIFYNDNIRCIQESIQQLKNYCQVPELGRSMFVVNKEVNKQIVQKRQELINHLGFIQLIAKIIEVCFPDELSLTFISQYQSNTIEGVKLKINELVVHELYNIVNDCYQLLQLIVMDNLQNKNVLFGNIQYFFHHFGYIKAADKCINLCIENNREIADKMFEKDLSSAYKKKKYNQIDQSEYDIDASESPQMESSQRDSRYGRLSDIHDLRSSTDRFILQEEESTANNVQKYHLVHYIIDRYAKLILYQQNFNLNEFYELLNKICGSGKPGCSVTNHQIQVQQLLQKKQDNGVFQKHTIFSLVSDVEEYSQDLETRDTSIDSIYKYLKLQANLCYGRNYLTKELVQKDFPFCDLVRELQNDMGDDEIIPENIKAALINIITHVYIDTRPFREAILPRYTKKFKDKKLVNPLFEFEIKINQDPQLDTNETILQILKISINHFKDALKRPYYDFKELAYSFLLFQRKLLSFKFLKLKNEEQASLYYDLFKTLGQFGDKLRNSYLGIYQNKSKNRYTKGRSSVKNATTKAILKSHTHFFQKANRIKTSRFEDKEYQEVIDTNQQQQQLQQNVLKEILRNFITHQNIRYDLMIERIIEFFNKVYIEDSKIKNTHDFIVENLARYMPGLPPTKLNKSSKEDLDSAIYFNENGDFIGAKTFILNMFDFLKSSEDYTLNFLIFKIIIQICFQQTNLMGDVKRICILEAPDDKEAQHIVKSISSSLQLDVEQSELWLVDPNLMSSPSFKYRDTIIQVKKNTSRLIELFYNKSDQKRMITRQIIFRNLHIQDLFLQILKECQSLVQFLKVKNDQNKVIIELLQNCYSFLILFVSDNNTLNKEIMYPHMNIFFESVDLIEMGQIKLLCKIFSKNSEKLQQPIPINILNKFFYRIYKKNYKSCYIKFLKTVITNRINKKNIVDKIKDPNWIEQILFLSPTESDELFPLETDNLDYFEPYLYHIEVLKLFNHIIENKDGISTDYFIQSLKKNINISKMLMFLTKPDIFSPPSDANHQLLIFTFILKIQLWRLMCNMWLDYSNLHKLQKLIENMSKKDYNVLIQLIQIESNKIQTNLPLDRSLALVPEAGANEVYRFLCQKINVSKYNEYYQYYTLVYIFPFLNAIQSTNLTQEKENQLMVVYNPYLGNLQNLLVDLPRDLQNQYPILCKLDDRISDNLKNFDSLSVETQFIIDLKDFPSKLYTIKSQVQNKDKQKTIYNHFFQEILLHNKNDSQKELWRSVVINLITSKYVKEEFCEKENDFFLKIISKMKNSKELSTLILRMNQFLVSAIQNNQLKSEGSIKNEVIKIINLLKLLIDKADDLDDQVFQQCKKEQTDYKQSANQEISGLEALDLSQKTNDSKEQKTVLEEEIYYNQTHKMQQIFSQQEIIEMIISNLCIREVEDQIFHSLIDLLISVLDGGNPKAQAALYKFFTNNNQSEILFERIEYFINEEIKKLEEKEDFNSIFFKSLNQLSEGGVENYSKIIKLIRFLQLLTEGHNEQLQEYVQYQANFQKNINLVQVLVDFSDKLLRNLSEQNYYILNQCLDTLTEFIQGPCSNNQIFISKTSILETTSIILKNYEWVENEFIKYYKDAIKKGGEKELYQKLLCFKTKSLFSDSKEYREGKPIPSPNSLVDERTGKFILTIFSIFADVALSEYQYLLSQVLGEKNPRLTVNVIEVIRQYNQTYSPWMIRRLQYKSLILMYSIIEGNKDDSILKIMKDKVSQDILIQNIDATYNQYKAIFKDGYSTELVNDFNFDEIRPLNQSELIIENGFKIYGLIQNYQSISLHDKNFSLDWLSSIIGKLKHLKKEEQKSSKDAVEFFHERAGYVEIQMNETVFPIYFPKPPYCMIQNERIFSQFQHDCDRSNQKSKLDSLSTLSFQMINEMKFLNSLNEIKGFIIFSLAVKYQSVLNIIQFTACVASNIMLLSLINEQQDFTLQELVYDREIRNLTENGKVSVLPYFLLTFEIIQILFSFILLVIYTGVLVNKAVIELNNPTFKNKSNILEKNYFILERVLTDGTFYTKMGYFICSILGLFNIAFIAFQLIDIFFQVRVFNILLQSVYRPRKQFLLIFFVFLLLQYFMTLIAYYIYHENYFFEIKDDDTQDGFIIDTCNSMKGCFYTMVDVMFKSDGGQTGFYSQISKQKFYEDYKLDIKAMVDFMYVMIQFQLIISLLEGLIVDTFQELRNESNKMTDDMENYCFICGINRKDEEKLSENQDFQQHVEHRHDLKNYVYYIAYLNDKSSTEYTGIESFVKEKLTQKDTSCFMRTQEEDKIKLYANEQYVILDTYKKDCIDKLDKMDHLLEKTWNQQLKQQEQIKKKYSK